MDNIFTEDIFEGERMGHGFGSADIDGFELSDVAEDGGDLGGVASDVGVGEFEAGKFGDVADLGFIESVGGIGIGRGGHCDISFGA